MGEAIDQDGAPQVSTDHGSEERRMREEYSVSGNHGMEGRSTGNRTSSSDSHTQDRQGSGNLLAPSFLDQNYARLLHSDPTSNRGIYSRQIPPAGLLYSAPARQVAATFVSAGTRSSDDRHLATGRKPTASPQEAEKQETIEKLLLQVDSLKQQLDEERRNRIRVEGELTKTTAELQQCRELLEARSKGTDNSELQGKFIESLLETNRSMERQMDELRREKQRLEALVEELESQLSQVTAKQDEMQVCFQAEFSQMQRQFSQLQMQLEKKQDKPETSPNDSSSPPVITNPAQPSDAGSSQTVKTFAFGKMGDINLPAESSNQSTESSSSSIHKTI